MIELNGDGKLKYTASFSALNNCWKIVSEGYFHITEIKQSNNYLTTLNKTKTLEPPLEIIKGQTLIISAINLQVYVN